MSSYLNSYNPYSNAYSSSTQSGSYNPSSTYNPASSGYSDSFSSFLGGSNGVDSYGSNGGSYQLGGYNSEYGQPAQWGTQGYSDPSQYQNANYQDPSQYGCQQNGYGGYGGYGGGSGYGGYGNCGGNGGSGMNQIIYMLLELIMNTMSTNNSSGSSGSGGNGGGSNLVGSSNDPLAQYDQDQGVFAGNSTDSTTQSDLQKFQQDLSADGLSVSSLESSVTNDGQNMTPGAIENQATQQTSGDSNASTIQSDISALDTDSQKSANAPSQSQFDVDALSNDLNTDNISLNTVYQDVTNNGQSLTANNIFSQISSMTSGQGNSSNIQQDLTNLQKDNLWVVPQNA